MRRETAGHLDAIDLRKAIETTKAAAAIAELLAVGYWKQDGNGYQIVHGMDSQIEVDVLAKHREMTAERMRKYRRKKPDCNE
jgi:hypothetical protein